MSESLLKKIRDILLDAKNPISSKEIAKKLEIDPGSSNATIRNYIIKCIMLYNLPVAGTSKGYFLISSEDELNKYVEELNERIIEIENRMQKIRESYNNYRDTELFFKKFSELKKEAALLEEEVIDEGSGLLLLKRQHNKTENERIDPLDKWLSSTVSGDKDTDSVEEHDVVH